ncbi:MAG: hypothetical protein LiPW41_473 [Parcubacteria group bacterium LiPW_41]|nr:MAG: hypothetical protein LiPW41_473 [Parcubacteria group bacterium LiPW_41]
MQEKRGEYLNISEQIETLRKKQDKILFELQKECTHPTIFETTYPDEDPRGIGKRFFCPHCGKEDSGLHPQNDLECSKGEHIWFSSFDLEELFPNKEYITSGRPLTDVKIKHVVSTRRVN